MASCSVEITLHERDRGSVEPAEYLPGETMHFTVTVIADEEVTVDGLEVFSAVETRGKGFGFELEGFRVRLFEGTLPPGTHTFEGSAAAPAWPSTHRGDHVGIDWWIHAVADVPWAADPKSREAFILRAPPAIELELPEPEGPEDVTGKRRRLRDWERGWLTLGAIALGGAVVAHLLYSMEVEAELTVALRFMGAVLGTCALLPPLFTVLRRALGGGDRAPIAIAVALKEGAADADYRSAQPEEGLTCTAFVEAGKKIDEIKGVIEIDEWAEWREGTGDNRVSRSVRLTAFRRARDMESCGEGQYRCVLPLPSPPYVCTVTDSGGHGIVWRVRIHVRHSGDKAPLDPIVRPLVARPAGTRSDDELSA